jgi:hypothetical protein
MYLEHYDEPRVPLFVSLYVCQIQWRVKRAPALWWHEQKLGMLRV